MYDLFPNYNVGLVFLLDEDKQILHLKTVSLIPGIDLVLNKLLHKKFAEYSLSTKSSYNNLISKSALELTHYQSRSLSDFAIGALAPVIANQIGKELKFNAGISIPIIYAGEIIEVTVYTKRNDDQFDEDEISVLYLLNEQLAICIRNAELFTQINKNIDNFKDKITSLIYK